MKPSPAERAEGLDPALRRAAPDGVGARSTSSCPPEQVTNALDIVLATDAPAGAYANGFAPVDPLARGETVDALETRADLGPQAYADFAQAWANAGACVAGGCCEVKPAHIAAIAERIAVRPRKAI